MKNMVISILTAILICGSDWWVFDGTIERIVITFLFSAIIWWVLEELAEYLHQRRMKQWRVKRIMRNLREMQNRP